MHIPAQMLIFALIYQIVFAYYLINIRALALNSIENYVNPLNASHRQLIYRNYFQVVD